MSAMGKNDKEKLSNPNQVNLNKEVAINLGQSQVGGMQHAANPNYTVGDFRAISEATKPVTRTGLSFFKAKQPRVTSPYYNSGQYYNSTMRWAVENDNIVLRAECIYFDFSRSPWNFKAGPKSHITDKNILPLFIFLSFAFAVIAPITIFTSVPVAYMLYSKPGNSYLIKRAIPDSLTWNDAYAVVEKLNELLDDGDYVAHELACQKIIGENNEKFINKAVTTDTIIAALPKKALKEARQMYELEGAVNNTMQLTSGATNVSITNDRSDNVRSLNDIAPSPRATIHRHANSDRNSISSILTPNNVTYNYESEEIIDALLVHRKFDNFTESYQKFANVRRRFNALEDSLPKLSYRDNSDLISCHNEFAHACEVVIITLDSNIGDGSEEVDMLNTIMDTIIIVLDRVERNIVQKRADDLYVSKTFLADKFRGEGLAKSTGSSLLVEDNEVGDDEHASEGNTFHKDEDALLDDNFDAPSINLSKDTQVTHKNDNTIVDYHTGMLSDDANDK